ncbi:hypothetical protein K488DRAFT_72709, partial [Vararia minispora EC-137]
MFRHHPILYRQVKADALWQWKQAPVRHIACSTGSNILVLWDVELAHDDEDEGRKRDEDDGKHGIVQMPETKLLTIATHPLLQCIVYHLSSIHPGTKGRETPSVRVDERQWMGKVDLIHLGNQSRHIARGFPPHHPTHAPNHPYHPTLQSTTLHPGNETASHRLPRRVTKKLTPTEVLRTVFPRDDRKQLYIASARSRSSLGRGVGMGTPWIYAISLICAGDLNLGTAAVVAVCLVKGRRVPRRLRLGLDGDADGEPAADVRAGRTAGGGRADGACAGGAAEEDAGDEACGAVVGRAEGERRGAVADGG